MFGAIEKLHNQLSPEGQALYNWQVGEHSIALNPLVGKALQVRFSGTIGCVGCGRTIAKSYQQGYCFPCTQRLAACDLCIVKPELCHFAAGTCRQPEWGMRHCMQPHYVYLANSSGLKVGITRAQNVPHRWIDQGASQAMLVAKTSSRYLAGLVELLCKQHVADKTNWRKMLSGEAERIDLAAVRDQLWAKVAAEFLVLQEQNQFNVTWLGTTEAVHQIHYPVLRYPTKIHSLDLDKVPEISGVLWGIKGQYLLLETGLLNVRKFSGYQVQLEF